MSITPMIGACFARQAFLVQLEECKQLSRSCGIKLNFLMRTFIDNPDNAFLVQFSALCVA